MIMTKEEMQKILIQYFDAWRNQDSQSLVELFDDEAEYRAKPYEIEEYHGKNQIKEYWEEHPVKGQTNPNPKLLNASFGENMCFAEWENEFINKQSKHKTT